MLIEPLDKVKIKEEVDVDENVERLLHKEDPSRDPLSSVYIPHGACGKNLADIMPPGFHATESAIYNQKTGIKIENSPAVNAHYNSLNVSKDLLKSNKDYVRGIPPYGYPNGASSNHDHKAIISNPLNAVIKLEPREEPTDGKNLAQNDPAYGSSDVNNGNIDGIEDTRNDTNHMSVCRSPPPISQNLSTNLSKHPIQTSPVCHGTDLSSQSKEMDISDVVHSHKKAESPVGSNHRNPPGVIPNRLENPQLRFPPMMDGIANDSVPNIPALSGLMQPGAMLSIGGAPMPPYGFMPGYSHPHASNHLPVDKPPGGSIGSLSQIPPHNSISSRNSPNVPPEVHVPQDLKIKLEVSESSNNVISGQLSPPQGPPMADPLQSLKEVKVPGYSGNSNILTPNAHSIDSLSSSDTGTNRSPGKAPSDAVPLNSSFLGPRIESIKKEPDYAAHVSSNSNPQNLSNSDVSSASAPIKSPHTPTPIKMQHPGLHGNSNSLSTTPPYSRHLTSPSQSRQITSSPLHQTPPVSHSALNLMSSAPLSLPTTIPGPVMHSSQQPGPHPHPFATPLHHPPHPLYHHHSLFAAAAAAHAMHPYYPHPHTGYPMAYPYPYGLAPQPHPIPPMHNPQTTTPGRHESALAHNKIPNIESTTMLTSHHSSSSSVMHRSLREISETTEDLRNPNGTTERHQMHETTLTHHHSTSHHSSVHASTEKQPNQAGANHSLTISHSTSSSSSQSIQHKINTQQKPIAHTSSPHGHLSASVSQTTSTSSSINMANNHAHHHSHSHHHAHHHERLSPADQMIVRHHPKLLPGNSGNPHHLMIQPPTLGHHMALGMPPGSGSSSLDNLRMHAQAAVNLQHQKPGSPHPSPISHSHHRSGRPLQDDHHDNSILKLEPPSQPPEEEEIPSPAHVSHGPSPEPKVEDTECHRSPSAIFLRHWNRGDFNSCTRTDLIFKPVPNSTLARKREERLRKQAEKDREERDKIAQQAHARKISTPDKPDVKPPSRGALESLPSPYERFPRQGYSDTPALRQLSEYARPHAGFSPGNLPRHCMDPMLQYQLSMYGPPAGARERLELEHLEREKRDREIRELRERELNDRLKEEIMKNTNLSPRVDPHWLEMHRRYGVGPPQGGIPLHQFSLYGAPSGPGQVALSQLERERLERLGIPPPAPGGPPGGPHHPHHHPGSMAAAQLDVAERLALATDPMVRLQMAGISPEYHAHTHAHTHAHSHTHLHLHPGQQQAAQAQQESWERGGVRPALLGAHPELLGRPYAEQLAQQAAAHDQLQRQLLLDRERFPPAHHTAHDDYLRHQQREREMKVRALEEAARGTRP